jgi:nitroimidazol reductase NimA-like FMN-containing flavoprotein (pyridoxamine 5'-phosphate oxidase superfamily)
MNAKTALPDADVYDSLTERQCRTLLATRTFGRVGVTNGGLPLILPVRYLYANEVIAFRTGMGTKLRAAKNGDVLAFEVDAFDASTGEGWSVLALGRAVVMTTEHEHDDVPTLDPSSEHETCRHYVRLQCELITGRHLVPSAAALQ